LILSIKRRGDILWNSINLRWKKFAKQTVATELERLFFLPLAVFAVFSPHLLLD